MICPICKRDVVKLIYKPGRTPAYECVECDGDSYAVRHGPEILFKGEGWTKKGTS